MLPNLASKPTIKKILKSRRLRPLKRLGQNFLVSTQVLNKIIQAAELKPEDIVLEVGPGVGTLTLALAKRVSRVIAVEKDRRIAKILKEILASQGIENVKVVQDDILNFQSSNKSYKLVSNLPYNIAAAVVMKFLEAKNPPSLMVVLVQKEVGQRLCSKPPRMTKLGVFCQFYSQPEIVDYVSKRAFWPQPKVDSSIIKGRPRSALGLPLINREIFSKIVNAGFSHPRKQLVNNFSKELGLNKKEVTKWLMQNNIQAQQRAETLTLNNWVDLARSFKR